MAECGTEIDGCFLGRRMSEQDSFTGISRSLTLVPPNSALQRTGHDKVLGRGRLKAAPWLAPSARVLERPRAVAELGS